MHLFLLYLLNDSQTIRSMIHFSKPLLCLTLICGDWSDWSHFHLIMPVIRAGLSNGHYGHGPRVPCALGAQATGRKEKKAQSVFILSANSALVGKCYIQ